MGFFDDVRNKTDEITKSVQTSIQKFKNADFAKAAMAGCALVAAADGTIDSDERQKTAGFIMSNPSLQAFDPNELRKSFDYFCDKLTADADFGKVEAIQAISKLKAKEDQARAIIQVCIIIGNADGTFDDDEKKITKEICYAVGIDPTEYDL